MERLAVSGSHGFIGKHLSDRLGQFERLDRSGIYLNCDFIFDLASYGNLASHDQDATQIYNANLMRIITASKYLKNGKLLYTSTSSVTLPVQTLYSLSKKAAEEYLKNSGLKVAIVRPYTVVGKGEPKEHLIPKLIDSCLNGTEMPFVPEPTHDFIDADDFVDALLTIKDKGLFQGEIYEVGSGKQTSNDEVRLLVEEVTGKKANVRLVDSLRSYDTRNWRANNERICSLGWKPVKTLKQSIQEMVHGRSKTKNTRY